MSLSRREVLTNLATTLEDLNLENEAEQIRLLIPLSRPIVRNQMTHLIWDITDNQAVRLIAMANLILHKDGKDVEKQERWFIKICNELQNRYPGDPP